MHSKRIGEGTHLNLIDESQHTDSSGTWNRNFMFFLMSSCYKCISSTKAGSHLQLEIKNKKLHWYLIKKFKVFLKHLKYF